MARTWTICRTILLVAALAFLSCSRPDRAPEPGADVASQVIPRQAILILLDAARSDRFSSYGYALETTPEMDALATHGAFFPQHYSQGRGTRFALPIMLYSRYYTRNLLPYVLHVPIATPEGLFRSRRTDTISLPKAFEASGFHTAMISAHSWLRVETEFAREFVESHDLPNEIEYDQRYAYPRAAAVVDYTIDWLEAHRDESFFLYIHLMDTHFPHFFDEEAQAYFGETEYATSSIGGRGRVRDLTAPLSESDRRYLDALYDGSLSYTDRHIGRLAAFLRSRARLDRTLVAITSDHGDMLLEHPEAWEHGGTMYEQLARTPFLIHYPNALEPMRIAGFSELVDVAPTILGAMGVEIPPGKTMDGTNLIEVARGDRLPKREVFARRMVRNERFKADFWNDDSILLGENTMPHRNVRANIFDLQADPLEKTDLGRQTELRGELFDLYRQRMLPYYQRYLAAPEAGPPDGPFAIEASHWQLQGDIPKIKGQPKIASLLAGQSDTGWSGRYGKRGLGVSWLFASEDAQQITLDVGVPNGQYFIAIGLVGSVRLEIPTVDGIEVMYARSQWFGDEPYAKAETIDLALVEITDRKLSLEVAPEPGRPWLLLQFVGFRPAPDGTQAMSTAEDEDEMIERLRTLGYLD